MPILIPCLISILLILGGLWAYRYGMEQRRYRDCLAIAAGTDAIWDAADARSSYENTAGQYTEYWFGSGNYALIYDETDMVVQYHADRDCFAQNNGGELTILMIGTVAHGQHQYKSYSINPIA